MEPGQEGSVTTSPGDRPNGLLFLAFASTEGFCSVALPRSLERLPERSCRTVPADPGDANKPNHAEPNARHAVILN